LVILALVKELQTFSPYPIALYLFSKWKIGQERLRMSFPSSISSELSPIALPQDGKALLRLNANN